MSGLCLQGMLIPALVNYITMCTFRKVIALKEWTQDTLSRRLKVLNSLTLSLSLSSSPIGKRNFIHDIQG
ncbi:hypothetical protein RHMOL_Rhmol01G0288800 [Rhododendron molle]|uniref:Uncharacterized protein n=1 Tax=Rhododendron molle TaxID=49168 RepID=A0ACC0Q8P0_RHOML|nr:hypothetical protein RHMOL_Rhmol01G0288800 [Rhododendron molle]